MTRRRFSIAAIMGLILFLAMIFAGPRSGSDESFKLNYTATFLMLIYVAMVTRYRGVFWFGFAEAGWADFLIGFGPWIGLTDGSILPGAVNRNLASSVFIEMRSGSMAGYESPSIGNYMTAEILNLREANRSGTAHCALTALFAVMGGLVSVSTARRAAERTPT